MYITGPGVSKAVATLNNLLSDISPSSQKGNVYISFH